MKAKQVAVVTPTTRERFAAARPMIIIVVFSLLFVIAASILPKAGYDNTPVGIRNKEGDGARALAQVLGDHGISVREVNAQQAASVDENTTLVVIFPSRMTDSMAQAIETRANVVYVGLEEDHGSHSVYLQGLRSDREYSSKTWLTPGCSSEIAGRTQHLQASDYVLSGPASGWQLCFSDDGKSYAYAERSDSGRFRALIPDSLRLRNRAISEGGNAALAINTIGRTPKVAWYSPTRTDTPTGVSQDQMLTSPYLMPAFLMIIAACLLAGLARGRRLGPLTSERLPIEVPASETLIGKARLMRSQRAYEHAAQALRSSTASRIATALGVAHTADREALTHAMEQRGLPASRCSALLWGPPPTSEMTSPIPGPAPEGMPQPGPVPAAPPNGYVPQGAPTPYAPQVQVTPQGANASFSAPTGEGWSGRALNETEKRTQEALLALKAEIGKAVVGQDAAISGLIVALVAGGHALLEGVPGVAKTLLVRTLSRALDVDMARIQFTPDLMPADITGSMVWDAGQSEFVFREGPVFTNLLLADEINRTPPKTQSALLESMEEHTVSIDGETRQLPEPFMVIATQNPVEYEGTYPLPEAQLDRFLLKLELPLPSREAEIDIIARHQAGFSPMALAEAGIRPVASATDIQAAHAVASHIEVSPAVMAYLVDLCRATRTSPAVRLGVSPRGATALLRTSRVWAFLQGRGFVTPDDVKTMAPVTLAHRLGLRAEANLEGVTATDVIAGVLAATPVPR